MAVQHEIKSQLAKLLATEDLVVEHKQVETASFNVETRVLVLPLWEKASNSVYDMLVGHEVGHALFTPNDDWYKTSDIPHGIVNVCEDARIEKLMKRKYMGLAKTFYYGYSELSEDDLFYLEFEDVDKFNLADRINLYFKIGNFIDLYFTERETEIRDLIGNTETFEEVLEASKILHEYCKEEQENKKKVADIDTHQLPLSGTPDQFDSQDSDEKGEEEENDQTTKGASSPKAEEAQGSDKNGDMTEQPTSAESDQGGETNDIEVKTVESLSENIQDLVSKVSTYENVYCEIPDVNTDHVIAKNSDVHKVIDDHYNEEIVRLNANNIHNGFPTRDWFAESDREFMDFKQSARKEVSYLVKEFECRKSASAYARAAIARTGVLDTSKLHTYKFNEDIFKKVTVLPDGKNHGLVFLLDWSGSMQYVMKDTIKQLYNLIWFCKKVQIPFEVYAFTNEWRHNDTDSHYGYYGSGDYGKFYEKKSGLIAIDNQFALMNLFTSEVNGKTLEKQMLNIWRVVHSFMNYGLSYPRRLSLSGTPLNEALITFRKLLPEFQKKAKVEKVQCVVLTDGEAGPLSHHMEVNRDWEEEPYMGTRRCIPEITFIRDRKVGRTYKIGHRHSDFTDALLENLQDRLPNVNFIGIRVLSNRDGMRFARHYSTDQKELNIMEKDWKKSKSYIIKNSGYDAYIVMSSHHLNQDAEFEVKEDATKSQIKSAFVKSLKTKKLNKKVLGEFISLVV